MENNLLYINEAKGKLPDSYYVATRKQYVAHASLTDSTKTQICIVGAGYTGLSTAIFLRRLGYDVIVLEAQSVGFGASGRNGGQVGIGQRLDQDTLESKFGTEIAKRYWQIALETQQLVESLIKDNDIPCDYQKGIIYSDHKPRFSKSSQDYVEKLQKNYNYADISYLDSKQAADYIGSDSYFSGIYDRGAGHLHPLNYCLGLAKVASDLGVIIHEQTQVINYQVNSDGCVVKTAVADVSCEQVVLACNGYIGELGNLSKPKINHFVMPINNYVVATEPLADDVFNSILKEKVAVADSKFVVNYFRKSDDNRLIFGGKESYAYVFNKDIKNYVRDALLSVYPQFANVKIDYGWGGTLAITMSRMPYFLASDKVISISGYSGHGVGMATLAGKLIANKIHYKTDADFELYQQYPQLPFPGFGKFQHSILVLGMLYYSLRDKF